MFTHYIKLINSFDRLCPQLVFFYCQPLNQQQTARCDKCDVGWGGRAGNQKKKRKKKEREMKKYIPAACCLSKGWPLRLASHYWDDLHKKISTLSAAFVICRTLQIRSISPVLKSLLLLILRLNVSLFMPIFCARLVCVKPALAIKPNRRFLLTKLTPPFVLLFSFHFWDGLIIPYQDTNVKHFWDDFLIFSDLSLLFWDACVIIILQR